MNYFSFQTHYPSGIKHRVKRLATFSALLLAVVVLQNPATASLKAGFIEETIGGSWNAAVGLTFDANGRLYVWEKGGLVWIMEDDVRLPNPLLDISEEVGNWRDHGMLGFALNENFLNNGYIYVMYVVDRHHLLNCTERPSGVGKPICVSPYSSSTNNYLSATIGRITRYTAIKPDGETNFANAVTVAPDSRKVLLGESIDSGIPILNTSHGVGSLVFGADGSLLASVGESAGFRGVDSGGGSGESAYAAQGLNEGIITPKEDIGAFRAQLIDSLNGKLLRIDAETGDGLSTNPFYDAAEPRSPRSRVWALGLRNPFRFDKRPGTGSHNIDDGDPGVFYIGDVGYFSWEDLNVATGPGMNFGWPIFEGLTVKGPYQAAKTPNFDAQNPLFGTGGCIQQYFDFQDLIQQATLDPNAFFPNPCNTSQQIPSYINVFVHDRPAIDWGHDTGPARTGIFIGNDAAEINLDDPGSPVSGPSFPGNSSTGGVFYEGDDFPPEYKDTYFHGDYGAQWIKNFVFDENDKPVAVEDFLDNGGGIVAMTTSPVDGGLYYISWTIALNKITYVGAGNQPPKAVIEYDKNFDADGSPLTVQFTGILSNDPEGGPLTYQWDFGDGSPINNQANPVHIFSAPTGVSTRYDVILTVTDEGSLTSQPATVIISVNNTPPTVDITMPLVGALYAMAGDSSYPLTANIVDAEQGPGGLSCSWLTALHHNNHKHDEPIDTNCSTSVTVSPAGCDGNTYFYKHTLTVTDIAGLSTTREVSVYPDCSGSTPSALSINDVSIIEGDSTMAFTVTLAPASEDSVNVNYATTNGTATGGTDFISTSGSLIYAPGEMTQTVTVQILGDFLSEGDEVFSVELSDAINAIVIDSIGVGSILDNEINICGMPGYDKNIDREVFLWKDCAAGTWHTRFTAGGGWTQYQGSVDAALPLIDVTPYSIEANDTFDYTSDPNAISYQVYISPPWEDGFDFSSSAGSNVCYEVTNPVDALVLIGPSRTPVASPFDLETLGPCLTTCH